MTKTAFENEKLNRQREIEQMKIDSNQKIAAAQIAGQLASSAIGAIGRTGSAGISAASKSKGGNEPELHFKTKGWN